MGDKGTVKTMPRGKDTKQVSFSASVKRKGVYKEAAARLHIDSLSIWIKIAAEEKLQRDCPDLYKRG